MKRILIFVIALFVCGNLFSQVAPTYKFRKPTAVNANTWKFSSVLSGVDAIVTITGSKNATIDKIDDSSVYAFAWQPFIKFTNTMSSSSDSSYVMFNISFVNSSNASASVQSLLAMTIVDCDGSNSIREMVKVSLPATASVISGSLITDWTDTALLNVVSGSSNFSNIDTSIYAAMTQVNFTNVSSYTMRIGAVGRVTANSTRQASFYFKPFSAFSQPLPVTLTKFEARLNQSNTNLTWSIASEENLKSYEVFRSVDGKNYTNIGSVDAGMNSNDMLNYSFTDMDISGIRSTVIYYKLKMVDNENYFKWSNITQVKSNWSNNLLSVNIFPNPATEFVQVQLPLDSEDDIDVVITDMQGKTVQSYHYEVSGDNNIQFDVRNFEKGIYFVNVMNESCHLTTGKFIKR